jgi:hypothetical protein
MALSSGWPDMQLWNEYQEKKCIDNVRTQQDDQWLRPQKYLVFFCVTAVLVKAVVSEFERLIHANVPDASLWP